MTFLESMDMLLTIIGTGVLFVVWVVVIVFFIDAANKI